MSGDDPYSTDAPRVSGSSSSSSSDFVETCEIERDSASSETFSSASSTNSLISRVYTLTSVSIPLSPSRFSDKSMSLILTQFLNDVRNSSQSRNASGVVMSHKFPCKSSLCNVFADASTIRARCRNELVGNAQDERFSSSSLTASHWMAERRPSACYTQTNLDYRRLL